jgi:preprotein translocase subunit SecA
LERFLGKLKVMETHAQASAFGQEAQARATKARADSDTRERMEKTLEKAVHTPVQRNMPKVGRNDPCPCGSGKKFKNCCGSQG